MTWRYDGHRHSLAARGVKSKLYSSKFDEEAELIAMSESVKVREKALMAKVARAEKEIKEFGDDEKYLEKEVNHRKSADDIELERLKQQYTDLVAARKRAEKQAEVERRLSEVSV